MGGASSIASNPDSLLAFNLARSEYDRLQGGFYADSNLIDLDDFGIEARGARIQNIFKRALEGDVKLSQLIVHRWQNLSPDDQKTELEAFLDAVMHKDRREYKPKAIAADYSKSFSGSAADTKNEKDAAALMRNDGGGGGAAADDLLAESETNPLLQVPALGISTRDINGQNLDKVLLRRTGPWLRFLSAADCFVYVHSLTKEVVSVRPEEYDEEIDLPQSSASSASSGGAGAGAGANVHVDLSHGLTSCSAQQLPAILDEIISAGKETPLILDPSPEQIARTFFTYKGRLADISSLTIPFGKSGMKMTDHQEICRKALVGAIKSGTTFCLYLGQVNIEHAELKNKFFKKDVFPSEVFQKGGLKLLDDYQGKPRFASFFREEDLEQGQAIARENFRVVVVSSLSPAEHEKKLADCIPLGYCKPIYLATSS